HQLTYTETRVILDVSVAKGKTHGRSSHKEPERWVLRPSKRFYNLFRCSCPRHTCTYGQIANGIRLRSLLCCHLRCFNFLKGRPASLWTLYLLLANYKPLY